MSNKDKKARHAALREFLIAIPGAFDRAATALRWLVVLAAIALAAMVLRMVFAHPGHPPAPPPGGQGDNPSGALYVRDLGRLPDGRHTFDLVYELVLRNAGEPHVRLVSATERLSIGDPPPAADVIDLPQAPGAYRQATGQWHEVSVRTDHPGQPDQDVLPGHWQIVRAHYRVNARPDQFADVAIGYTVDHDAARGWFTRKGPPDGVAHDEDVQLGAVLRAHCPLGVKVQNGEMRSLCAA